MKRFLALAALVLGIVSCQTEPEGLDVIVGGEQEVMVNVALPEGTRARSDQGFDLNNLGNYRVRYILEIYLKNEQGVVLYDKCQRHVKVSDDASVAFPVRLAQGRDYQVTVWADIVVGDSQADRYYYTAEGLDAISIITWNAMDETRDAYTAFEGIDDFNGSPINLTLKRPFAKVRVVTTDIEQVRALGIEPTTATVVYSEPMLRNFNAVSGTASDAAAKSHGITYNPSAPFYNDDAGEMTLFADYIFVPADGTIQFNLDVEGIKSYNFNTEIPVKANNLTTIKGYVLTEGGDVKVEIEDEFENGQTPNNPPYYVEIWDGESQTEPEVVVDETGTTVAVIDTPSDLAWFAGYVNGTNSFTNAAVAATRAAKNMDFVLSADIDLGGNEWTPIGNKGHHFDGTFDGNNHTIKGLCVTKAHDDGAQAALFGTMSGHPVIKNFVIDGAYIKYPNDGEDFYASAVAGTIYGYVTFENITVKNSTITGNNKVGAIFAHDGSSNQITVNNCHVDNCYIASEDLKDGGNVGGLIGLFQTGSTDVCKISNSSVKNSIIVGINSTDSGKRANSEFIGGILTKATTNLVLENCVVENNYFSQTIDGTDPVTYVGAFPAQFIGGDRNEGLLGFVLINGVPVSAPGYEKLANYPNIYTKDGNYYVFGVAGLQDLNNYFTANSMSNHLWSIEYNIGADIDATGFTWNGVYVVVGNNDNHGIVLNGNNHTISNLTINNCLLCGTPCGSNAGVRPGLVKDITMKDVVVNGSSHDAAIFWGNCCTNVDFENVTVDGAKIKGGSNVGALVSRTSIEDPNKEIKVNFKNCVVKNSTLEADNLNADPTGASGFIGRAYGKTQLTFEDCSVENNTINNANGLVGGAVYGYTTWYGNGFYGTGACDTFTNWNGLVVETVAEGLLKKDSAYVVMNAEGLAALNTMMVNKTAGKAVKVTLGADIDFAGKTWTPVDSFVDSPFYFSELDGSGYTITNLTINGQAMFTRFAGTGNVTIKNVTFDNATVNSNGAINTSILTVQSYQNVLLDNVDVKNSSITGGYKVAPLIATVYNENPSSTITATLKNCDVENTVVKATSLDFCTAGMVAFVYEGDNDRIEFENCSVKDVQLYAPNSYTAHATIYTSGSETLYNEVEGVTVTNVTFENI